MANRCAIFLKALRAATGPDKNAGRAEDYQSYAEAFVQHMDLASYALMLRMPGNEDHVRNADTVAQLKAFGNKAR